MDIKKILFLLVTVCSFLTLYGQKVHELVSPDHTIRVEITVSDGIYYDVFCKEHLLLKHGTLQMQMDDKTLGLYPKLIGKKSKTVNEFLKPVVPFKFSTITNHYNQLLLNFRGNYSVEFRVFDDGIAYRFITDKKGEVEVTNELFQVSLPEEYLLHVQQSDGFKTAYEEPYSHLRPDEWNRSADKYTLLPVLIEAKDNYKILISESDLADYPAMFLTSKGGKDKLTSVFPRNPIEFGEDGDRSVKLLKEAGYLAKTRGKRNFPWRYFVITSDDGQLIENTMTARLAESCCKIADPSWIKPGLTTWEWWNGATPYGPEVDFVAGCNTDTYKYFIDFASKFGIEYILLDEGWAQSTRNPYVPNKGLDLQELIQYGKQKNVGVVLWLTWLTVDNNFELFKTFSEWGIKGVKIDFMDRSDQWMVNFYERVAAEAAKYKLFVDFHGAFKPAGLEYKYPNVLSYEGVRGMEQMGGCRPENSIFLPFLRNAVGPMDYTPGAMLSYQPETYRAERPNSGSIGTRAYQMALYVLFETGLQMMADNPTLYYREEDCARFMAEIPVETDETVALAAKVGEYVVVAKRKKDKWYIGGITNGNVNERVFDLSLDFLDADRDYHIISYEDGVNANRQAMHYVKKKGRVRKGQILRIRMARNGGFAAVID